MPATVFPTHDVNFIASCRKTGRGVSGSTHEHALQNFHSLVNSSHTDEESRATFNKRGAAPFSERGAAMRNKPRSISNSRTRRASFVSRSFPFARIFDGSGCLRAKRSVQGRNTWNTLCAVHFGTRAFFFSGNRCFASVLQNPPSRVSDVFHVRPSVWFRSSLIRNLARGFVHDGLKISVTRTSIGFGARAYE